MLGSGEASDTGGMLKEQTGRLKVGTPTQRHNETTANSEPTAWFRGHNGKLVL